MGWQGLTVGIKTVEYVPEYVSSYYWKRASWNNEERVSERSRSKDAVERVLCQAHLVHHLPLQ
jgi:hypothetical protein